MVDVFISYSKSDRPLVERLDAALNAAGFTTWWDKGLIAGEDFGPTIDRHIREARAVLCLWTPASVNSLWVRAEATKASEAGKLIPVKSAAVTYDGIPPPFNILDTASLEDPGRVIAAVQALLARPATAPRTVFLARAWTRQELLSWFGIIGAVLTVAANVRGLADIAIWARWLLSSWLDIVAWFWKSVLFFLPRLSVDDASLLSIIVFLLMNIAASLRPRAVRNSVWTVAGCWILAGWIVGSIYWSAFDRILSSAPGVTGTIFDWLWVVVIAPLFGVNTNAGLYPATALPIVLASSLVVLALGLTGIIVLTMVVSRKLSVRIDTAILLRRLVRIVIGVALLVGLSWLADAADGLMIRR
jgi:hypothetical protein